MSSEELPTSGGIPANQKPYHGMRPSEWRQKGWRKPVTTPEMRDTFKQEAAVLREEEPGISENEVARRLAVKHGLSAATIKYYI